MSLLETLLNLPRYDIESGRILTRSPDPLITEIAEVIPGIFDEARGILLCGYTPINLIGAMLAKELRRFFIEDLIHHDRDISAEIRNPVAIYDHVPLLFWDGQKYAPFIRKNGEAAIATKVVAKKTCGIEAGADVMGSAGLLLAKIEGRAASDGMCINHIWNDERINSIDIPSWAPYPIDGFDQLSEAAQNEYWQRLETLKRSGDWVSNIFLRQLKDSLGIAIPNNTFHRTRPLE